MVCRKVWLPFENCLAIVKMLLTKQGERSKIFQPKARRGSSVVEQGTHKPLVVGSNPTLATPENLSTGWVFSFGFSPVYGAENGTTKFVLKVAIKQSQLLQA